MRDSGYHRPAALSCALLGDFGARARQVADVHQIPEGDLEFIDQCNDAAQDLAAEILKLLRCV